MFDRNQKDFPTFIHRTIFNRANFLLSPEISLKGISDTKTKSDYMDLYNFLQDFYEDIYKNPGDYYLDAFGLEKLCKGRQWRIVRINAGWRKDKETIEKLEQVDTAILPWRVVFESFKKFELNGSKAVFEKDIFQKVIKRLQRKFYPKPYMDTVVSFLERNGVVLEENENNFTLSSHKYPQMFVVLKKWADLLLETDKTSKRYLYHSAFHHLDYRAFLPDWKISFEDVLSAFDDQTREYVKEIHALMTSLKINPTIEREWMLDYKTKGKTVLQFQIQDGRPAFIVPMFNGRADKNTEYKIFEYAVESLPDKDKIKTLCKRDTKRCVLCGCHPVPASMLGNWVEIFGRKMKVCGGGSIFFITGELTESNLKIIKDLAKIRYDILKGK